MIRVNELSDNVESGSEQGNLVFAGICYTGHRRKSYQDNKFLNKTQILKTSWEFIHLNFVFTNIQEDVHALKKYKTITLSYRVIFIFENSKVHDILNYLQNKNVRNSCTKQKSLSFH